MPIIRGNPGSMTGVDFFECIADVRCNGAPDERGNYPRAEANARLISAAPDLLKACEHAFEVLHYLPDGVSENEAVEDAYAACMKALGKAERHPAGDDVETEPRGVSGLTGAGEEVAELRDENKRLKERVADLEAAIKPLSHYDVDAARETARFAREQGLAEVANFVDDACDDITRALLGFFDARDAQAEVPHE